MPEYTVINPATEQAVTTVALTSADETDAAAERAAAAQATWREVAAGDRRRLLRRFAAEVDAHTAELAALEVNAAGHPIGQATWEAEHVRDVLKPAEITPLTAIRIGELPLAAGLPEGVLTVLPGRGSVVGQRLVDHPLVRKIVFTGSAEVGREIMAGCARQVKRVTLELGGKSANIVFADADLERAAATAPYAVFDNAGQDCCARSRILVQRPVFDRFMELLEPAVAGVRVGDPSAPETGMGPLISAEHRERVASYVPDGAPVAFRGSWPDSPGFWFPPTVLAPAGVQRPACTDEMFGPVVTVTPVEDEADAVAIANDTPYGLSGSIWTENVGRAIRVARGVKTGNLSVNSHSSVRYWTPFGGFKQSGLGRELGPDALDSFTDVKNVFIAS